MINLLPPSQKKDLKQEKNFKLVLTFGLLSISYLLSLGLLLFLAKIMLNADMETQKTHFDQKNGQLERLKDLQNKVAESNSVFLNLKNFYSEQTDYSDAFNKISSAFPSGISVYSVSFLSEDDEAVSVSLRGFSKTREDLNAFKKSLEAKTDNFSSVVFPPESWIKKTNIDFEIGFKVLRNKINASQQ
ncbi:MAG: hypothetical protein WC926_03475 [Candidatus Paceibacterota bacterium]|jgi:Tfp pilus assembly protein PilN